MAGDNPHNQKAIQGQILAANQLLDRYPDATLIFEDPIFDTEGELIRVTDISVMRPSSSLTFRVEVKEITTLGSIGDRAIQQLARDIVQDAEVRRQFTDSSGNSPPHFASFQWQIRYSEIATSIAQQMGIQNIHDPRVRSEVRTKVQARLERAFQHSDIQQLTPSEIQAYLRVFQDDSSRVIQFF